MIYKSKTDAFFNSDLIIKARSFFISRTFMILTALLGAIFIFFQAEVLGVALLVLLMSLLLVVCDDVLSTTLPFLILCVSVLQCYDSFDTFIKFVWLAPIPVAAVLFHFIYYRKKIRIGNSFLGLLAVGVAVTFGGLGTISAKEYFAGISLYYVAALGFGMAGAYLLIRSQIQTRTDYDIREKFVDIMYIMGMFTCFQMLEIYYETVPSSLISFTGFVENPINTSFSKMLRFIFLLEENLEIRCHLQPGNNVSTFIMIALPFPMYRALKSQKHVAKLHLLSVALMAFCMFISKSRGGLVMGAVAIMLCFVAAFIYEKNIVWKILFITVPLAALTVAIWHIVEKGINNVYESVLQDKIVSTDEPRMKLLTRSFEDFLQNPVFGQGIGNVSNADLYAGKKGTITWYHMMIPQIYGSMGSVGILAYAYQFFGRVMLTLKKRSLFVITVALSYGGLFLMSQVNPGEFCPIPYGLIAVILFIMIENEPDFLKKPKKVESA